MPRRAAFNAASGSILSGATDFEVELLWGPFVDGDRVTVVFETKMTHSGEMLRAGKTERWWSAGSTSTP